MMGVLVGAISCSDEDDSRSKGVFTVNTPMFNHMYNTVTGEVIGISSTHNLLTLDINMDTATLVLYYNDGSEKTLSLRNLTVKPTRLGFYELTSSSNSQFKGYVDINEGSMRYFYTTDNGIRIISATPEVFFLKTKNTISYDDTTETTVMESTMYQFELSLSHMTATIKVEDIVHAKDLKSFIYINGNGASVTPTANGFTVHGENINTEALYYTMIDSLGSRQAKTDKYPFKTFNADVDLLNDSLIANYMIGSSATVYATGRTYPNYTTY